MPPIFAPLLRCSHPIRDGLVHYGLLIGLATASLLLAGCQSTPLPPYQPSTPGSPSTPSGTNTTPANPNAPRTAPQPSYAGTPRDYRRDGAQHLYSLNAHRIYKGKLPPMLYAVGVLETELDSRGQVIRTHWLRAPKHAPEVITEIENTVRNASPFPAPARLGRMTYTDTWLWDESGRFQLDTLTEGQE